MNHAASVAQRAADIHPPSLRTAEDDIYRRISWRVMPIVLVAYVFAFLDRTNVGYA